MQKLTLLIVSLDEILRQDLQQRLVGNGFKVIETACRTEALRIFEKKKPALIIIYSTRKDPEDELRLVEILRKKDRDIPVILITIHSSEAKVIAALRAGVDDYFKLPFPTDEVLVSVRRLITGDASASPTETKEEKNPAADNPPFIGKSRPMGEVKLYLYKVAKSDSTVLITGETGTGKELAAKIIHYRSPRSPKPLVCVNCAALPDNLIESELFGYDRGAFTGAFATQPGKFELAAGGTVFLDEIGDMSSHAQAKILRSIENKKIYHLGGKQDIRLDARIIAATNRNPEHLLAQGVFREDLFYRLNVARVHLPPLRERRGDIPRLVNHAIQRLNSKFGRDVKALTDESMSCLYRYKWPGNVRELFNCMEATFISMPSREMHYIELPKNLQKQLQWDETDAKDERNLILNALLETKWNKSSAAQKLNWSRMTLYRKIEKYNIVEKRSRAQ